MAKVCLSCYEIYKNSLKDDEWTDYQFCPKVACQGEVVEIDELLLPTIIELNKKGYITKYCCAGHYYDRPIQSYIMFEENIELPSLPKNYIKDNDNNTSIIIRNTFTNIGNVDTYKYVDLINNNANSILKWAKSLSYNDLY